MEALQFIQTTPEALVKLINEGVKIQLDEFKKTLNFPNSDEILTRKETCEFLKINSSTLFHWTNKGKLTAIGIGNRRYYKKSELLASLIKLEK
ncbi:helix-turn-helix domain-containing protein [Flavobacterium psychrophilum]|nr:helix-turn-helix domain-containing protein [Flavobacterium psychrophilum]